MDFSNYKRDKLHKGQLLAFSGIDGATDFEDGLVARTKGEGAGLEIKLPSRLDIELEGIIDGDVLWGGDHFELSTTKGSVRGVMLDTYHLLIEGEIKRLQSKDGIAVKRQNGKTLVGSAAGFDGDQIDADIYGAIRDRQKWISSLDVLDRVPDRSKQSVFKALTQMKTQVYSPEGSIKHRWTTPDRWPHRSLWLWDSVFHAVGWRHVDEDLAREMLGAVFDNQEKDGFVPLMANPSDASTLTQPPLLALGVELVDEIIQDDAWVKEMYPKLKAYLSWNEANRDTNGDGLLSWRITADPNCRSGESGMDNSPRFDRSNRLEAVDFNAYMAREYESMARFARRLGLDQEAKGWNTKKETLDALINQKFWSPKERFYFDHDLDWGGLSDVLANAGFLPLLSGTASKEQARHLAKRLTSQTAFGTMFPVPTVALKDARYEKDMWRGPTWMNLNWLITRGFERYGFQAEADIIREKTIGVLERNVEEYGTFFEFYDDRSEIDPPALERKGSWDPTSAYNQVIHDYGWSATLYLDLLLT